MGGALIVQVTRRPCVESRHVVVGAVVDARGQPVETYGDAGLVFPARSSVKMLQALPLVATGAADSLPVSEAQLALACGSHSGEEGHRKAVRQWLELLGLDESSLQCAPRLPMGSLADDYLAEGGTPTRLAHNCSGKHTGFLALSRHLGTDPPEYLSVEGRVQRVVLGAVAEACGVRRDSMAVATDGCGAPVPCLTLIDLARGMARAATGGGPEQRVVRAMAGHPWLVAGSGRFDTLVIEATAGMAVTKAGAEGVHVALLPEPGLGVALKCLDGGRRASQAALVRLLRDLGALGAQSLEELAAPAVHDDSGREVGRVRVVSAD